MKKSTYYPSIIFTFLVIATIARGQTVLFSENFESYAPDSDLTAGANWSYVNTGTDTLLQVVEDNGSTLSPADSFGQGTSNHILHMLDNSTSAETRMDSSALSFQVATLSFLYYETSDFSNTKYRVSFGKSSNNSTDRAFQINFQGGVLSYSSGAATAAYTVDALHKVDIVVNTSASPVSYNGDSASVASLTADVWVDGVLVFDNISHEGSTYDSPNTMTHFRYTTDFSGASREAYIDDIILYDGAVIPEPEDVALLFSGATGVIALLLRKNAIKKL